MFNVAIVCRSGRVVMIGGATSRVIRKSGANSAPLSRAIGRCLGSGCRGPKGIFVNMARQLSHPIDNLIVFTGADGTLSHLGRVFGGDRIGGAC